MTHASLFSGIGGFDLAAQWMGWDNLFWCEIDPFCKRVLRHHFPNSYEYDDIHTADFTLFKGRVDVLTGGFPCQPFSVAGKRKGTADARWLWGQMYRAIRELRPRYIVAENVYGLLNQGGGLAFEQVINDLETAGYEVQSFVIPAYAIGAPHRRDRLWIVAYHTDAEAKSLQFKGKNGVYKSETITDHNERNRRSAGSNRQNQNTTERTDIYGGATRFSEKQTITDTENTRREVRPLRQGQEQFRRSDTREFQIPNWQKFPTIFPVHNGDDGFSDRLVDITFPRLRREAIKACGNAIVPQVAYEIFKVIEKIK